MWEKILIEGGLFRRSHSIPLNLQSCNVSLERWYSKLLLQQNGTHWGLIKWIKPKCHDKLYEAKVEVHEAKISIKCLHARHSAWIGQVVFIFKVWGLYGIKADYHIPLTTLVTLPGFSYFRAFQGQAYEMNLQYLNKWNL